MPTAAVQPQKGTRGDVLLLAHCAAVARLTEARASAGERLEASVGRELARLLVGALTSRRHVSPRGLARQAA